MANENAAGIFFFTRFIEVLDIITNSGFYRKFKWICRISKKNQNYFIKDIKLDFSTDIGDFHHFYQRLTFGITSENSGKSTIFRQKLQAYL